MEQEGDGDDKDEDEEADGKEVEDEQIEDEVKEEGDYAVMNEDGAPKENGMIIPAMLSLQKHEINRALPFISVETPNLQQQRRQQQQS